MVPDMKFTTTADYMKSPRQIIGIVGFIGSGKDTLARKISAHTQGKHFSFAAPLKDAAAAIFGWPRNLLEGDTPESRTFRETTDLFWSNKLGIAEFTPRLALQVLGTDVLRNHFHTNIWLNSLEYRLQSTQTSVVISDARFQNELDLVREQGGKIIWVQRGPLPEWYDIACRANQGDALALKTMQTRFKHVHRSEWDWAGYPVDIVIDNNGTLEDLDQTLHSELADLYS